ncbi:hypothetical protein FQN50_001995 [Emmonsiellopsis sp. PD_5]|nr:hypothetical protein FQN50_001995 [Emmonsiellopsis sp. PD_5]
MPLGSTTYNEWTSTAKAALANGAVEAIRSLNLQIRFIKADGTPRKSKPRKRYKYDNCFYRIILDEAHHIKSLGSDVHAIIQSMHVQTIWLNTATPAINKVNDLAGFLNIMWRPEWQTENGGESPTDDEDLDKEEQKKMKKACDPGLSKQPLQQQTYVKTISLSTYSAHLRSMPS